MKHIVNFKMNIVGFALGFQRSRKPLGWQV